VALAVVRLSVMDGRMLYIAVFVRVLYVCYRYVHTNEMLSS